MNNKNEGKHRLRITADRNIPYLRDAIDGLGDACYLPGDAITPDVVRDTDILLTRTRTRCDAHLLESSRCSFIATATIGTDHIDLDYCAARGITVANAPGCNAPAVAQYVLAAIGTSLKPDESFSGKTLGIIGAGNVGSILARWAEGLGMKVLLNDPPKCEADPNLNELRTVDGLKVYRSADEIARECDIISIHTPYTISGRYPTRHLIGEEFLKKAERKPMIINAARGSVADTAALKSALAGGLISALAIDCWEGEPDIDSELLDMAVIATPHIAGYSLEGKIRATRMVLEALARHIASLPSGINDVTPGSLTATLPHVGPIPETITPDMLRYDIVSDSDALKNSSGPSIANRFETLRNTYRLRHEPY